MRATEKIKKHALYSPMSKIRASSPAYFRTSSYHLGKAANVSCCVISYARITPFALL